MIQKLLIFQSLWAMERRHTDGHERSLDENVAAISEGGFDGVSAHYTNRHDVVRLNEAIRRATPLRNIGVTGAASSSAARVSGASELHNCPPRSSEASPPYRGIADARKKRLRL
jgi:hypothetical protein